MKRFVLAEYLLIEDHCIIPIEIRSGLHQNTSGNICQTGCANYNGGYCSGYKILTAGKKVIGKTVKKRKKTNAQYAEELGITKRQVSKRRKAGLL